MHAILKSIKFLLVVFLVTIFSFSSANAATRVVKKSKTNICHAPGTKYYKQTKYYKAFKTLQECLDSGGRLPKRK
jgi:hypothetical protein